MDKIKRYCSVSSYILNKTPIKLDNLCKKESEFNYIKRNTENSPYITIDTLIRQNSEMKENIRKENFEVVGLKRKTCKIKKETVDKLLLRLIRQSKKISDTYKWS